jgi:hypothetical protein
MDRDITDRSILFVSITTLHRDDTAMKIRTVATGRTPS